MESLNYIKPIDLSKCNLKEQLNQRFGVASLMQVDAKGPQDTHIHDTVHNENNKSIFESDYQRHTLFFPWYEELEFNQTPQFGQHFIFKVPVKRKFMIDTLFLQINLPQLSNQAKYINNIGFKLIKKVKMVLNGEILQEYTGDYLKLMTLLHTSHSKLDGLKSMTGMFDDEAHINGQSKELFVHLPIFPSTLFPLHAIFNSDFLIDITFESLDNLIVYFDHNGDMVEHSLQLEFSISNFNKIIPLISFNSNVPSAILDLFPNNTFDSKFFLDYQIIYDDDESKLLLTNDQEFVYESVEIQTEPLRKGIQSITFHFNSRVKQLLFVFSERSPKRIKMYLNSSEIEYSNSFHTHIQPFFYDFKILDDYPNILQYSFSMYPHLNQPSGNIHFGTLYTKTLLVHTEVPQSLTIYAICYKILKVSQGLSSIF
tara:strand:+ start:507 stop:1787 length:1281 start_codon:yes stop_codon:yes gene_type:complete